MFSSVITNILIAIAIIGGIYLFYKHEEGLPKRILLESFPRDGRWYMYSEIAGFMSKYFFSTPRYKHRWSGKSYDFPEGENLKWILEDLYRENKLEWRLKPGTDFPQYRRL